jgi:CubicO group peptidase (beta-lactamase class C family)
MAINRGVKIFAAAAAVLLIGFVGAGVWYFIRATPVGTGYAAKYLCTSTFVSKRDPATVFAEDVEPLNPLMKAVTWKVDATRQSITATAYKVFRSTAIYRRGCGCTLIMGTTEAALRRQQFFLPGADSPRPGPRPDRPWPEGGAGAVDPAALGVDAAKLDRALDHAFAEPGPGHRRRTRAVAVVYDGQLIAERYAPGFGPGTPMPGWSISKSVTNALVGILVGEGKLALHGPAPVPEWQSPGDPRTGITLDQLLRMSSGLAFEEVYWPLSDVSEMLFKSYDFAAFAAAKPLVAPPGGFWHYSSGTANILARIVRQAVQKQDPNYYRFIRRSFFDRIGMTSAVIEADPSGTFVGSSYALATVRDWARFGLLYLRDGVWNNERILPAGWVKYSTTPAPKAPMGEYGALFWLNAGARDNPRRRLWPHAPLDAFAAQGFQEQKIIMIPSEKLVLLRFGATSDRAAWDTDAFIAEVIRALPR